jgi:hypothetical protein
MFSGVGGGRKMRSIQRSHQRAPEVGYVSRARNQQASAKTKIILSLIILLSLGCAAFQRTVFYGQNVTAAPSGPTYQYVMAESGSCSALSTSCSVTLNTVNGDLAIANCLTTGGAIPTAIVTDANGETWNDENDLAPNNGTAGITNQSVTVIAHGGAGDVVTCQVAGTGVVNVVMFIDSFRSSTGWSNQDDGTPTDQGTLNSVIAPAAGPCTVTARGATAQAHELVYGACLAIAGTSSTASGYTIAQNSTFTSIGQALTGYAPLTIISTPTFTTNGTLTDPQSLILTFAPN